MKISELIVIFLLMVSLIFGSGCIDSSSEPVKETGMEGITDNLDNISNDTFFYDTSAPSPVENFSEKSNTIELEKQSSFSGYYSKENLQFGASVPTYSLPLEASEISNYGDFIQNIPLTNESRNLLYKNGFVVIENRAIENLPGAGNTRVNDTYRDLKVADVPIFITSDSLLHLYHIQFDETLKRAESGKFYDELWKLDKALLEASVEDYDSASGLEKEAARRNVAYFAVALSLLEPKSDQIGQSWENFGEIALFDSQEAKKYSFEIPSFVKIDVDTELHLIEEQEGGISPIFKYGEDYSQYTPRGHYTHSEKLKNYFMAMMWHGRISMLLQPEMISSEDPEKEAKIQTIQAFLISDHFDRDKGLRDRWDRIYEVTAFYVGFSDDLGPMNTQKFWILSLGGIGME